MKVRGTSGAFVVMVLLGLGACHSDTDESRSGNAKAASTATPASGAKAASQPAYDSQQPAAGSQAAEAIGVADPVKNAPRSPPDPTSR